MSEWGSLEGDNNAKTIIADRSRDEAALIYTLCGFVLALVGLGIWYALTGARAALALEIGVAAVCAAGWARKEQYSTHTFVMVAEQRARNIEARVEAIAKRP